MTQSTKRTLVAILPGMGLLAVIWSCFYAVPTQAKLATAVNTSKTERSSPRIVDCSAKIIANRPASDTPSGNTMFFASGIDNPFAPGAINHLYVSERKNDSSPWGPRIYLDTINCATCFGVYRPFGPVAKKFVGWAIGETAMATWISTARRDGK